MPNDTNTEAEEPKPKRDEPAPPPAGEGPGQTPVSWPQWLPLALASAMPLLFFFLLPPLTRSGLWDPYELNVADLARRVALNLHGATNLRLEGADNSLPHLNDLGRPQLPFTSIALGFKLFGLHEWAGRMPLAVWGLLGVLATFAWVSRLFDRRTGLYAAVVLTTTPLYFVQARSMLGDVCTMAGLTMAFGGLAVAAFDRDEGGPTAPIKRLVWLGMGALGLAVGYFSRGGLLGAGVPLLSVGLAWAVARLSASRKEDLFGDAMGAVSLAGGAALAAMAARVIAGPDTKDLSMWVGALLHFPAKYPTFDFYLGAIGHSMAPWSAFLPFALARLLVSPVDRPGPLLERESLARLAVVLGGTVAVVAHGYLAARTELIAFTGPAICAVACAVAIRDLERGANASVAIALGTLVLAAVLHHDFHELPEKAYQAFGIAGATFPESFKAPALNLWWVVLGGFALCAFFTWVERDSDRKPFHAPNYSAIVRAIREAYDGMLVLVWFATIAGASLAGLVIWIGVRLKAHWLPQMPTNLRDFVLNLWWGVAFIPPLVIFGAFFACDVWLWTFGQSRPFSRASLTRGFDPFEGLLTSLFPADDESGAEGMDWWTALLVLAPLMLLAIPGAAVGALVLANKLSVATVLAAIPAGVVFFLLMGMVGDLLRHRAPGLALGGVVVGFVLCFFYYPALANQLSPKEVFEAYGRVCPGSPLALLGVGGRTSAYYAGGQPQTLTDTASALAWLAAGGGERRCLAMKAEELPKLNQLWREKSQPRANLPVLDARSSQILLAASTLGPGDKNENPLAQMVLSSPPHPQRVLNANMDDKLEVIGVDLDDERGKPAEAVAPGRSYHLKTYYRVLAPVTSEWEAFIHIDGYHRRHNGDHKPMNGKYPMSMWLPGDVLVDDHEFKLEPNFTPGNYQIYFGLFMGDTRLKVKSGPNDGDNRINGGALKVQ
jgi:4-amino-4-deoxy-L-arabinose transferase-like glycosyltransferase